MIDMYYKKISISTSTILSAAFFAAISAVALVVSFMAASYLYARSTLIPYGVLLALSFILLELLVVVYFSTLSEFGNLLVRKTKRENSAIAVTTRAETKPETKPKEEERQIEIYEQSVKANHILTNEAKEKLVQNVHDYLYWIMAPLLEQEDVLPLWIEIEDWMNDRHHTPKSRNWKWKQDVNVKYSDIGHLIWNIAKRMGMENGYGVNNCASFIVRLFPDLCRNVKDTTIAQNLTANPDKGCIKIDRPDEKDPIAFHYPMPNPEHQEKE